MQDNIQVQGTRYYLLSTINQPWYYCRLSAKCSGPVDPLAITYDHGNQQQRSNEKCIDKRKNG